MSSPLTPPGHTPPAEIINATHHGGWIIIAASIGLCLVLFSLLVRLYVRFSLSPIIGFADYVLGAAGVNPDMSVVEDERS